MENANTILWLKDSASSYNIPVVVLHLYSLDELLGICRNQESPVQVWCSEPGFFGSQTSQVHEVSQFRKGGLHPRILEALNSRCISCELFLG